MFEFNIKKIYKNPGEPRESGLLYIDEHKLTQFPVKWTACEMFGDQQNVTTSSNFAMMAYTTFEVASILEGCNPKKALFHWMQQGDVIIYMFH